MSNAFKCPKCKNDLVKMLGQQNTKTKRIRIKTDYYYCKICKRMFTPILRLIKPILLDVTQ